MRAITGRCERAFRAVAVLVIVLLAATAVPIAQEKAGAEGIKVHGHWIIDVKNPDGTLASHTEFENALHYQGQGALAFLFTRQATILGWDVFMSDGSSANFGFIIQDPAAAAYQPITGAGSSANLTVTMNQASQPVLQGSVTAAFALQIARVDSEIYTVASPPATNTGGRSIFTQHTLPQPIPVQANQIVQVTVVFSFS